MDKDTEDKKEKKAAKESKLAGVVVGRNVHFVVSGGFNALAFITRVHDKDSGVVNLFVVRDDQVRSTNFEESVKHSTEGETGTWHFIEQEK